MRKIITIGREFGAAGSTIGRQVAKELGIEYYDRDLIIRTAEASNSLTPEDVHRYDEKVPTEFGFSHSLFSFYNKPLAQELWNAQVEAIRKIANTESCVIVGRNADYILREFDHTLRVFIHADEKWRVAHMAELMPDATVAQIEADLKAVDKARKSYCSHYTGQVYGLSDNYDLTLDVGKLGIDLAVKMILQAAETI